jgi:AcrR family transcriptional regulator
MRTSNTKELLLQATLKLISEKGYLGTTTREIASEAGVTEITLFRNFGSKELLFEEVLKTYTFLPRLRELLPKLEDLSCEEALVLIATRFLQTLKERKALIQIMYQEVTSYPEKIRDVYNKFLAEVRSTLANYIATLQERGELRKDVTPEMAARVFLAMFFAYFRQEEIMRLGGMKKQNMEKYIQEVVDIYLHGTLDGRR